MTDLDMVRRLFADAVFSGIWEPIAPEVLDAFADLVGIPVPGVVVVAQAEADAETVQVPGVRELRLHEGMVYLCVPPTPVEAEAVLAALSARRLVHGEALGYDSSREFLPQLREAIVSLRQRQLHLPEGWAARPITYQEEVQSSALALRELRQTGRPGAACEGWLDLVFVRHQKHLHQLRMRLFEMLGALSATVDGSQQQGYVVQAGLRRMLESYALPQLRQACRGALGEAAALVVLSGANTGAALVEGSPLIGRALKFIQARFAEPISLAEVARAAHASPEHLAREFRRRTGRTVIEALQLLRINHARQLLAESDRTILDIAFSSGFESAEHFYRTFKKLTGTTPRTYRLRHGG